MIFGAVLGFLSPVATLVAPQPIGSVIFFGGTALYMAWVALKIWRRTGLPFVTTAVALAAIDSSMVAAAVLAGYRFRFPSSLQMLCTAFGALAIVLLVTEERVHATEWELWRRHMEHMGALDVFSGRHIPDLRHRST
jgi:hypothetical protein